ncbi:ALK and LTK ligand 2b [Takifugu rubripes]|uniref:ALK and LTK ligand 1 n=1 Tax=Takifugu rubripes TaxID=31033 RepID=A0A3B5K4D6_TAKRU|nr:ALK and LTK ligand 2 [Takifugu rubripes]XP_056883919.1 ALK and LTK ligand 2-like [Takifugu flavidus]|eukprot:XP_011604625.1 PREDICTED: protein FAM150B [Takifugu rubripes]
MLLPTLLILMLVAGRCAAAALLSGPGPRADGRMEMRKVLETVGRHPLTRTVSEVSGHAAKSLERGSRSHQGPEGNSRDPRHKEKFIRHLTGPLYVNKKCRRYFHKLYHTTRDCTTPAFFKRCALLLTRLAKSRQCTER